MVTSSSTKRGAEGQIQTRGCVGEVLASKQGWMQQLCLQRARASLTLLAMTLHSPEESVVLE